VGLYTQLFYAIIPALFLCFLLICYPYIFLHFNVHLFILICIIGGLASKLLAIRKSEFLSILKTCHSSLLPWEKPCVYKTSCTDTCKHQHRNKSKNKEQRPKCSALRNSCNYVL